WGRRRFADLPRRRTRLRSAHAVLEDLALRARCTRREQPKPAVRRESLTSELIGVPPAASGSGWPEPDSRELVDRREVGDLNVNLPCPRLAQHLCEGRDG